MRCFKCYSPLTIEMLHEGEYCLLCQGRTHSQRVCGKWIQVHKEGCGCVGHISISAGNAINRAIRVAMKKQKKLEKCQQEFEDEQIAIAFRNFIIDGGSVEWFW